MNQQTIDAINTLGNFCGKRDIEELTSSTLTEKYNIPQADILSCLEEVLSVAVTYLLKQSRIKLPNIILS